MLNVMLKQQFRGGKETLVVTSYTNDLRAFFYKDGVYVTGGKDTYKLATITPEYDIVWDTKYNLAKSAVREIHSALAMHLKSQVPVSANDNVTPAWCWFDGVNFVLSETKPEDHWAIMVGYSAGVLNKPMVLTSFSREFVLKREDGQYVAEHDHRHLANYRGRNWLIEGEDLKAKIDYLLDTKIREKNEAQQAEEEHQKLLVDNTVDRDADDGQNYGPVIHWGMMTFENEESRFVRIRAHDRDGTHFVMAKSRHGGFRDTMIATLKRVERGFMDYTPLGKVNPTLTEVARVIAEPVRMVMPTTVMDYTNTKLPVRVVKFDDTLFGVYLTNDNYSRKDTLLACLEKQADGWVYFHLFGQELQIQTLAHFNGAGLIKRMTVDSVIRQLRLLVNQSNSIKMPRTTPNGYSAMWRNVAMNVHQTDSGIILTLPTDRGECLVGVIESGIPGRRDFTRYNVYYPRSSTHFDYGDLSKELGMHVVSANAYTGIPEDIGNESRPARGGYGVYGHSNNMASPMAIPVFNTRQLEGTRYSELNYTTPNGHRLVRFLGTPHDGLAHCLFVDTDNLLINDGQGWRKFNTSADDAVVFQWLVSTLGGVIDIAIRGSWVPDVNVDVKHHNGLTITTLTKHQK